MMPILVKNDDVRSGRKAKACHGWLQPAQESVSKHNLLEFVYRNIKFIEIKGRDAIKIQIMKNLYGSV